MLSCRQSEFAENSKLVRMNEEIYVKLDDLERKIMIMVNEINALNDGEAVKPNEDDLEHSVGC
jgi:hypothetical protein